MICLAANDTVLWLVADTWGGGVITNYVLFDKGTLLCLSARGS